MDEAQRLDDHPFSALARQLQPPADSLLLAGRIGHVHDLVPGRQQQFGIGTADLGKNLHVPWMVSVRVDVTLGGEQVERGQLEVGERFHGPAVLPVGGHESVDVLLPKTEPGLNLGELCPLLARQAKTGLLQRQDRTGQ